MDVRGEGSTRDAGAVGDPSQAIQDRQGPILDLTVLFGADGTPAAQERGWIDAPSGERRDFQLDGKGTVAVERIPRGARYVWILGRGRWPMPAVVSPPPARIPMVIQLPPGMDITGRAVDAQGHGVPRAEIILAEGEDADATPVLATAGLDGTFKIRALRPWQKTGPNTCIAARAPGHLTSAARAITGSPGGRGQARLVLQRRAGHLAGSIRNADGSPVAGARVEFHSHDESHERLPATGAFPLRPAPARVLLTDAKGLFRGDRLPLGEQPLVVRAEDLPQAQLTWLILETGGEPLDVVLAAAGRITGRVLGSDGAPAAAHRVTVKSESEPAYRHAWTDGEGHFLFPGMPAGPAEIKASRGRPETVVVKVSEASDLTLVLPAANAVEGTLRTGAGEPLPGYSVLAIDPEQPRTWQVSGRAGAGGEFRLEDVPPTVKRLEIRTPSPFDSPVLVAVPWPEDTSSPLEITVPVETLPSSSLSFRVVSRDGSELEGLVCSLSTDQLGGWSRQVLPDPGGWATVEGLVGVAHRLVIGASGCAEHSVDNIELTPGALTDLGEVQLGQGGWVTAVLLDADGTPLTAEDSVTARLVGTGGKESYELTWGGAELRSPAVPPGSYTLTASGFSFAQASEAVPIAGGETARLELTLSPGGQRLFSFEPALPEGSTVALQLTSDPQEVTPRPFQGAQFLAVGLAPGTWRIQASTGSDQGGGRRQVLRGEVTFRIAADDLEANWDAPIEVQLR